MRLKQLFTDDSAVSPVIGVILMVAITVILAAVIGTFVLNLGSSIQSTAPQAQIQWSYNQTGGYVNATHTTGDALKNSTLSVTETGGNDGVSLAGSSDGVYTAGEEVANGTYDPGETIRIVWNAPEGSNSATIASSTAPSS